MNDISDEMQKNPDGDGLQKKVIEWLDRQGYPLEMYAAKCCRDAGLYAYQSWYYLDKESGQQRETDVFAHTQRVKIGKEKRDFELSFTFECKQSRAKPWVAFVHSDEDAAMSPKAVMAQRITPQYTLSWWMDLTHKAARRNIYPLQSASPTAYSLARASLDRSNEDTAFAALMSVAKASIGIADWLDLAAGGRKKSRPYFCVVIPVLVLDARLFSCRLNNDSDQISVAPIDRCTLQWSNQVNEQHSPTTIIEVVTKESLPTFLDDMNAALAEITDISSKS
jgi:hypothetical protein